MKPDERGLWNAPMVIGRGPQMEALERFVQTMRSSARVWFATHGEMAELVTGGGLEGQP